MSNNFFLDGNYTASQIKTINKIKGLNLEGATDAINGDASTIFDEINSYKKDKTADKNSDLFKYIEKTIGMDSFMDILDADGNGEISEDEAKKISSYDSNTDLSSADIDALAKDMQAVTKAESTKDADGKSTKTTYEIDPKTNKLVKKTASVTDTKTNKELSTYTYNTDGTIKQKVNKVKNTTTDYTYNNGKKETAKTYANDKNKTLKVERTYDENGKLQSKTQHINRYGVREETFTTYGYDDDGKIISSKKYKGNSADGTPFAEYTYDYYDNGKLKTRTNTKTNVKMSYEYDDNGKLKTRTNESTGATKNYEYDSDGKLSKVNIKNKAGKITSTYEYDDDGTIKSKTTDKYVTLYEYGAGGIRTKAIKYKASDIADGKPKKDATAVSTTDYSDGLVSNTTTANQTKKYTYDKDGNKTKEVITNTKTKKSETINYDPKTGKKTYKEDGTYVYIYSYDSNGKETVKKYKASDCKDGKPKDGAKPITD